MRIRVAIVTTALLLSGLFGGIQQASAAPQGSFCHINGKAVFSRGLGQNPRSVTYTFSGKLDNCASSSSKYSSARISATGAGSLSCGQGSSKGKALVTWNSGRTSTVKFSTSSAAALVYVQGKVTRGAFRGDPAGGPLIFEANPQDCMHYAVKSAKFDGGTGVGNYK